MLGYYKSKDKGTVRFLHVHTPSVKHGYYLADYIAENSITLDFETNHNFDFESSTKEEFIKFLNTVNEKLYSRYYET